MRTESRHSRRDFVKLALAAAVVGPVASRVLPAGVPTGPGFQMVNGWILMNSDVAALQEMLRANG